MRGRTWGISVITAFININELHSTVFPKPTKSPKELQGVVSVELEACRADLT